MPVIASNSPRKSLKNRRQQRYQYGISFSYWTSLLLFRNCVMHPSYRYDWAQDRSFRRQLQGVRVTFYTWRLAGISMWSAVKFKSKKPAVICLIIVERLRSRFFSGISREPRTSRSQVTSALAWGLQFEVPVCIRVSRNGYLNFRLWKFMFPWRNR